MHAVPKNVFRVGLMPLSHRAERRGQKEVAWVGRQEAFGAQAKNVKACVFLPRKRVCRAVSEQVSVLPCVWERQVKVGSMQHAQAC